LARCWRREDGGNEIASVYGETTYLERIAPRLQETWTLEEIYTLED